MCNFPPTERGTEIVVLHSGIGYGDGWMDVCVFARRNWIHVAVLETPRRDHLHRMNERILACTALSITMEFKLFNVISYVKQPVQCYRLITKYCTSLIVSFVLFGLKRKRKKSWSKMFLRLSGANRVGFIRCILRLAILFLCSGEINFSFACNALEREDTYPNVQIESPSRHENRPTKSVQY